MAASARQKDAVQMSSVLHKWVRVRLCHTPGHPGPPRASPASTSWRAISVLSASTHRGEEKWETIKKNWGIEALLFIYAQNLFHRGFCPSCLSLPRLLTRLDPCPSFLWLSRTFRSQKIFILFFFFDDRKKISHVRRRFLAVKNWLFWREKLRSSRDQK